MSAVDLLPSIVRRASLFHGGWASTAAYWLLLAAPRSHARALPRWPPVRARRVTKNAGAWATSSCPGTGARTRSPAWARSRGRARRRACRLRRQRLDRRLGRGDARGAPRGRADRERPQPGLPGGNNVGIRHALEHGARVGRAPQQRRHARARRDRRVRARRRRATRAPGSSAARSSSASRPTGSGSPGSASTRRSATPGARAATAGRDGPRYRARSIPGSGRPAR